MNKESIVKGFNKLEQTKTNMTNYDAFIAGIEWVEFIQKRDKILSEKRKLKKFIPTDFIGCPKNETRFLFKKGIKYENEYAVYTDAHYIVKVPYQYPVEWEGKLIDSDDNIIDYLYPNYDRVIPNIVKHNYIESTDFNINDIKLKLTNTKSIDKQLNNTIDMGIIKFNELLGRKLVLFWQCFPNAKLYKPCEDISKPWILQDNDNMFVFAHN